MSDSLNSYSWTLKGRNKSKRNPGTSPKAALDDNSLMAQLQTNLPMPDLFSASAYQGTCIHPVNGVELVTACDDVAYWPAEQTLLVADLHLEKDPSFARRGQPPPPYDTMATLKRLAAFLEKWQPRRVIALGDSFHDHEASSRLAPDAVQLLTGFLQDREWIWITGNHDPLSPEGLGGQVLDELKCGKLILRHASRNWKLRSARLPVTCTQRRASYGGGVRFAAPVLPSPPAA